VSKLFIKGDREDGHPKTLNSEKVSEVAHYDYRAAEEGQSSKSGPVRSAALLVLPFLPKPGCQGSAQTLRHFSSVAPAVSIAKDAVSPRTLATGGVIQNQLTNSLQLAEKDVICLGEPTSAAAIDFSPGALIHTDTSKQ
jgi:hypothetical protein